MFVRTFRQESQTADTPAAKQEDFSYLDVDYTLVPCSCRLSTSFCEYDLLLRGDRCIWDLTIVSDYFLQSADLEAPIEANSATYPAPSGAVVSSYSPAAHPFRELANVP